MEKIFKPLSGREFPRFSGFKTFFRLPVVESSDQVDAGILGVPFDGALSYRPGARFAPSAMREASSLGRGYQPETGISWVNKLRVGDLGDCSTDPLDIEATMSKVTDQVLSFLKRGIKVFSVGGDHLMTLALLRAYKQHFQKPLAFIHFDAHLDTYPAAWGHEFHHGAFARHAVTEGLVDPKQMFQFGIRGPLVDQHDLDFVNKHGIKVYTVSDIRRGHLIDFCKSLPQLSDTPLYISYDIDVLDPAYAPGTGTPVPGGLTTYETQQIFQYIQTNNLVGGDVMEVSPPYDQSQITSLAGVDALFQMLCLAAKSSTGR